MAPPLPLHGLDAPQKGGDERSGGPRRETERTIHRVPQEAANPKELKMNWNLKKAVAIALITLFAMTSMVAVADAGADGKTPQKAAAKAPASKIKLNAATAEQLESLPRIGPKTAQRIVEYRDAHDGFKKVDELRNVKGIGPKVLELIRPHVTL
jgi:comEA protein